MTAEEKLEWVGKHVSGISSHCIGRDLHFTIEFFDGCGMDCEASGDSFEEALDNAIDNIRIGELR